MPDRDTSHHPHHAELINPDGSWKYTNALIDEASPYLRQHAHNPVDWLPWGERAFEQARERDVPIFLSIGYSTCYWCHVMERLVFESPAIAERMNELFVNVKVDRETRPDIDDIYMTATQVMTRRGGWPMSVFLTPPGAKGAGDPGLRPFWCGTYIPPEPMHGMASFPQVLSGLNSAWETQRQVVIDQADQVADLVEQQLSADADASPIDPDLINHCVSHLASTYDAEHGGFGDAPKFPQPASLALLLAVQQRTGDEQLHGMIRHTLDRMARGGMFDQVGGGFHRYSVDERWLVPHFEKMLYDNGQLAELYADAARAEGDSDSDYAATFERVARETCDYAIREMTDPTGAFWSAQDAEVHGHEGGNYLWTPAQVASALDDDALTATALKLYGLDLGTNFQDPHVNNAPAVNVLYLPQPLAGLAQDLETTQDQLATTRQEINRRLLAARNRRDQPAMDDKVLTAWNGMIIAGLARTGAVLKQPQFIDAAARAADAVLEHLAVPGDADGGMYRAYRDGVAQTPAFLEDYAHFIHGLLVLHRHHGHDAEYLDHAVRLTRVVQERFAHEAGGYFDTLAYQRDLFVRTRSTYDGATPSGNSQMIHNLIDLAELTGNRDYLNQAGRDLQSFATALSRQSVGMTHMVHALLRLLETAPQTLTLTPPDSETRDKGEVAARLSPNPAAVKNGKARATLDIIIAEGLHLTAPGSGRVQDTDAVALQLIDDGDASLNLDWPDAIEKTYPYADAPIRVYQGRINVPLTVQFTGDAPDAIQLRLTYQPCTDEACHLPAEQILTLELTQA